MKETPPAAKPALLRKAGLVAVTAGLSGTAGAFFLAGLDALTRLRLAAPWWLFALPVLGGAVAFLYQKIGGRAEPGMGLILQEIREPGDGVPGRMGPLILLGTLATHLGGGSAGREGTAVQLGGSLAAVVGRMGKAGREDMRGLLMAGMAAGFGAVFGTPWAASVFVLEVIGRQTARWKEWPWVAAAAWLAHGICLVWGARHTAWAEVGGFPITAMEMWGKVVLAALGFGLVARFFVVAVERWREILRRTVRWPALRPVVGGLGVIGLVFVSGTRDYLGLGTLSAGPGGMTLESFLAVPPPQGIAAGAVPGGWPQVAGMAWAWKLVFTVMTVGSGFKGGEVTPLFFIGAALGQALSLHLNGLHQVEVFAALGMVAVFSAAAKTPVTGVILGMELFGAGLGLPLAVACGLACLVSGRRLYRKRVVRSTGGGLACLVSGRGLYPEGKRPSRGIP